jgi:hypothetical protein
LTGLIAEEEDEEPGAGVAREKKLRIDAAPFAGWIDCFEEPGFVDVEVEGL